MRQLAQPPGMKLYRRARSAMALPNVWAAAGPSLGLAARRYNWSSSCTRLQLAVSPNVTRRSRTLRSCSNTTLAAAGTLAGASASPLHQWVESQGGRAGGVRLADLAGHGGGSGWGLVAAQDAPAGSRLIELPACCHLTFGTAPRSATTGVSSTDDDPRLLSLIDKVPTELWGAKLALQVLAQRVRGPGSPFGTYIRMLPPAVAGLPMFFPREAIDALEYPPVSQQIRKRGRWLSEFAQKELARLPGTPEDPFEGVAVDINALGWALAVVTSRAFRTRGASQPAAMLPLIDMANHSFDPNCEVVPTSGGAVAMVAKQAVSAGEPLLLSYGQLSNDFLLLDYGFVVPNNQYDRVALRFDPALLQAGAMFAGVDGFRGEDADLQAMTWKTRLLEGLKLVGPAADTEVTVGGPGHVDPRLVGAARVLAAANPKDLAGLTAASLGDIDQPLRAAAAELAALRTLSGVASFILTRFTCSPDADKALLARQAGGPPDPAREGSVNGIGGTSTSSSGSSGEGWSGGSSRAAVPVTQQDPLPEEVQLAIRFRMEKKLLLLKAAEGLGKRISSLAEARGAAVKGSGGNSGVGRAASNKGFGRDAKPKR